MLLMIRKKHYNFSRNRASSLTINELTKYKEVLEVNRTWMAKELTALELDELADLIKALLTLQIIFLRKRL
jgi:hypothetical protein